MSSVFLLLQLARTTSECLAVGVRPHSPSGLTPLMTATTCGGALVEYLGEVSERLQDPAPAAVGTTWAVDGAARGMPSWIDGDIAYRAGYVLIAWLIDRAIDVHDLRMKDSENHLFGLVRKLASRYIIDPIERPASRRWCSVCGEKAVAVAWVVNDSGEAVCRVCGATYAAPDDGPEEQE